MDPAQRGPAGQDDAAMIDLGRWPTWLDEGRRAFPLNQRTAAGWAPVHDSLEAQHGVAVAANAFHNLKITGSGWPQSRLDVLQGLPHRSCRYTGGMHPPIRLVAIDMDGTLLPAMGQALTPRVARALKAAQEAGITVAVATDRKAAYTAPILDGHGLRADMPLITSNGAVTRTLGGEAIDRCQLEARVARGLCGLLRPFGVLVFTFDKPGRGELVLEEL